MPDLHLRERLPELKLPEMSRDDIAKALGEARKELGEVRKDLNDFRKAIEIPKVDVSQDRPVQVRSAEDRLRQGTPRRPERSPRRRRSRCRQEDAQGGPGCGSREATVPPAVRVSPAAVTLGLVGWALANSPSIKARLRLAAQQIQDKMAERQRRMGRG